ncbi:hypothetical protein T439DRAFT_328917 [Meredithblackwellia eburnea MCA 4105]
MTTWPTTTDFTSSARSAVGTRFIKSSWDLPSASPTSSTATATKSNSQTIGLAIGLCLLLVLLLGIMTAVLVRMRRRRRSLERLQVAARSRDSEEMGQSTELEKTTTQDQPTLLEIGGVRSETYAS